MNNIKTEKIVFTALFTALCCVVTMVVHIPSPTGGYINPGDAVVLLSAFLLGPFLGAAAAGLGSALSDLLLGYVIYVPATLVIKAAMALCAGMLMRRLAASRPAVALAASALLAELIMIFGYFAFTAVILGFGAGALAEVPGNCVQGLFGALAGSALYLALTRSPYVRRLMSR